MSFYEREKELLQLIDKRDEISINELLSMQYTSKSTLRRDLVKLEEKGLVIRTHGGVRAVKHTLNDNIPFFLRENEQSSEKKIIAQKAAELISDGDVIMLDATTSAYCIIPYLTEFKDLTVITSGAKASFALGELGIKNICTGGEMVYKSFSYVGMDALHTIGSYNADIAFFSCRGLSEEGYLTDKSIEENAIRKEMIKRSKKKIFLCNSNKI